jgi:hypothetical protein
VDSIFDPNVSVNECEKSNRYKNIRTRTWTL